jgi:hypothetical protein
VKLGPGQSSLRFSGEFATGPSVLAFLVAALEKFTSLVMQPLAETVWSSGPRDLSHHLELLSRSFTVESELIEADRLLQQTQAAALALLLPLPLHSLLALELVHERCGGVRQITMFEPPLGFPARRLECLAFVGALAKFLPCRLNPVIEPGNEVVAPDLLAAKAFDNRSKRRFRDALVGCTLEHTTRSGDCKQFGQCGSMSTLCRLDLRRSLIDNTGGVRH